MEGDFSNLLPDFGVPPLGEPGLGAPPPLIDGPAGPGPIQPSQNLLDVLYHMTQ